MKVEGTQYRSIELCGNGWSVRIFDQRQLPWKLVPVELVSAEQAATAIKEMWTRGAPLIAMTGAYGLCLGLNHDASDEALERYYHLLLKTRPTAVNLRWALDKMCQVLLPLQEGERVRVAYEMAAALCEEDVAINKAIGEHGLPLLQEVAKKKPGKTVNILMHCNPGWLATVDYGTATAPIYLAHDSGIPVHVWVDETRPRHQGAALTSFELQQHGVPHTVISDNAGGYLMQTGQVDLCLVGADRVTRNGDVCNKIGTYLKALAAKDNDVPFYVGLPYPTIDFAMESGKSIPIEERCEREVTHIKGQDEQGGIKEIKLTNSRAANPAFDVTPQSLVTAYITDQGVFAKIKDIPS